MKRISLLIFAFALMVGGMRAQMMQQMPAAIPNDTATRVGKLDNGLTYYLRHN